MMANANTGMAEPVAEQWLHDRFLADLEFGQLRAITERGEDLLPIVYRVKLHSTELVPSLIVLRARCVPLA